MSGQSNLLCVNPTPINVGIRVVRGPDWKWANQDDGEGHVGTVVEIGQTGSHITPEKTVIVQWDSGNRSNYRVGYQNAYDLRILDNAQIGIIHYGITCSYCDTRSSTTTNTTNATNTCINGGTSYITGIRWKCSVCTDVNLCSKCYHSDRHNLSHYFVRIDAPGLPEVSVATRATSNPKLNIKGIFVNSKVIRGYDWDWENQDGGAGKVGKVVDIRGWTTDSFRSVANVIWPSGLSNVYRLGHRGKVDLKYVAQSDGGKYYRDHLPILSISSDSIHLAATPSYSSSHSVSKVETTIATSTHSHGPSNNNNGSISNSNSNGFVSVPSTVVNNTADIVTSNDSTDDATITATSTSSETSAPSTAPHHHPDWSSVATSGISGSQLTASSSTTLAASTANAGSNGATSASPHAASSASSAVGTSTATTSSSYSSNAPCTTVSAIPSEATSIVPASTSSSKKTAGYATNSSSSTPALPFKVGDKVKVVKNRHELRVMQTGHGGWNPKMAKYCFQVGVVHRITVGGDVRVKFGLGEKFPKYTFHPESLAIVYFVGDAVKVIDDLNQVKALQDGHGEWVDQMKAILGAKGKVIEVYPDGDLRVSFENDKVWTMNPATVNLVQSNMAALESALAASASAASSSNSPVATVTSAVTSSNDMDDGTLVTSDNTNMLNSLSPRFAQISLDEPHLVHHNGHGGPSNGRTAHGVTGNRQTLADISDVLSMDATMTSSPSSTSVPVAIPGVKHLSRSSHHSSDGGHVLLRKDKNNHTHVSPNNAIGSPSGSGVTTGQTSDSTIERMRYLENKIAEMEEVYCCGICLERVRNVVFLCGHGACVNCAQSLRTCHMCRQVITRKINIY